MQAKNTVKQRILQQKRSKIHAKFTKMQRNFNTYETSVSYIFSSLLTLFVTL